jgi:putative transposase
MDLFQTFLSLTPAPPTVIGFRYYQVESQSMIVFKGAQYPEEVILFAVFFYVRYGLSYRDLEEIMAERGVSVDHTTLNRWVTRYSRAIADAARRRKGSCDRSWRTDETYITVKGSWVYLYRAVDKYGKTRDFMLSQRRNKPAATKFFARMLEVSGLPRKIVIDKSGANNAGIRVINKMLKGFGCPIPIEMVGWKYLNNIVEQDHRFIKRRTRPMLGFKAFASASATLAGIEVAHMMHKGNSRLELSNSAVRGPGCLTR